MLAPVRPPSETANPLSDKRAKSGEVLESLLGDNVIGSEFATVHEVDQSERDGVERIEMTATTQTGETVPLTLLLPLVSLGAEQRTLPAILYCHAHGNDYANSRLELLEGRPSLHAPYGPDLTRAGFAVLSMDMPCFGARQQPGEQARGKAHLWRGTTLFGQMLHELVAGISLLSSHPRIDHNRIGALGFSMGSTHAYWLAALDERVKAAVALCSFGDLGTLLETGAHDGHGLYMTVPGLTERFSTGQIAGLAAPRALFIGAGMQDWSTPLDAFSKARAELELAYAEAPEQLAFHVEPDTGHEETPDMRAAALAFLEAHL